ncbi:MAG: 30S ribosomal protein S20 [bacterium]
MPVKKNASKALKQSQKRAIKNFKAKKEIKDFSKKVLKAIDAKNTEDIKKYSALAIKSIDKATQKKILKKNTGARKKSVLMRKVNSIK